MRWSLAAGITGVFGNLRVSGSGSSVRCVTIREDYRKVFWATDQVNGRVFAARTSQSWKWQIRQPITSLGAERFRRFVSDLICVQRNSKLCLDSLFQRFMVTDSSHSEDHLHELKERSLTLMKIFLLFLCFFPHDGYIKKMKLKCLFL